MKLQKIRILSIFDGIGGARQALKELDIDCDYYASEIDPYAIQIAKANHPDIGHIGDVNNLFTDYTGALPWKILRWGECGDMAYTDCRDGIFDLLIGGFPCQSFSIAGNKKGFEDERGNLFFELLRILKEVKPKYFLFENVASMSKANKDFITEKLGVEPIMINSNLVTAQNRKRLYFTNIPDIKQPEDKKIFLKDILQDLRDLPKSIIYRNKSNCLRVGGRSSPFGSKQIWNSPYMTQIARGYNKGGIKAIDGKTPTLSSHSFQHNNHIVQDHTKRRLSVKEACRLQGYPDSYFL